jgi:hypothetical protein
MEMDIPRPYLQLDKLSVYGPDGFFAVHKDTPKVVTCSHMSIVTRAESCLLYAQSENHVGTLLICLPVPFAGGILAVGEGSKKIGYDWSNLTSGTIAWAFFYADVDHEVLPVQSGFRTTLQLQVYGHASSAMQTVEEESVEYPWYEIHIHTGLLAALSDALFLPDGGRLAVTLRHDYAVSKAAGTTNAESVFMMLKGMDKILKKTIDELKLNCEVVVVFRDDTFQLIDQKTYDENIPSDKRASMSINRRYREERHRYISKSLNNADPISERSIEAYEWEDKVLTRRVAAYVDKSLICNAIISGRCWRLTEPVF